MSDQNTGQLMMIRPAAFSKNKETAINNYFQVDTELKVDEVQKGLSRNLMTSFKNCARPLLTFMFLRIQKNL